MREKKVYILLILFIVFFSSCYFFWNTAINYLSVYLSKSEKVKANILLVEGWITDDAIKEAYNEFQTNGYEYVITSGLKSDVVFYKVSMGGNFIFYPGNRFLLSREPSDHIIEVSAYSELDGAHRAHFNLFINDSLVSDFLADKKTRKYLTRWEGELSKIDSIIVQFDNDKVGEFGDRNLYVRDIIIDHKIKIPFLNNSVYDIIMPDGNKRIINNYNSNAELTRNKLLSLGIDTSKIKALPGKIARMNRTVTSALAVRDWLEKSDIKVDGINIVSAGTHSRRTWMIYNKVLHKSYKIGVISLPDSINSYSGKTRPLKTLRETIAIIYYWIILFLY